MKSSAKLMMVVLALALGVWAQSTPQTSSPDAAQTAPTAQANTKSECPCCQKTEAGKDAMSCCAQHGKGAKEMSCCSGKGSKSCMKADKSATASCTNGKCCDGKSGKDCCAGSDKGDKMAMACCGHGQCGKSGDQATIDK